MPKKLTTEEFIRRASGHLFGKGCLKCANTSTANDCVYFWRVTGTDTYKIGITSQSLGTGRINHVASDNNLEAADLYMWKINNAREVETMLHQEYTEIPDNIHGDGKTEFRIMNKNQANELINFMTGL